MAYPTWTEAVRELDHATRPAADELRHLALRLGITPHLDESQLLLIARIEDAVATVTGKEPPRPPTPRQISLLGELHVQSMPETVRVADALIKLAIADERRKALESLRPVKGDRLVLDSELDHNAEEDEMTVEVSSIDRLGCVWIRGARGYPILPQNLSRAST